MRLHNPPEQVSKRKELRSHATLAERVLWKKLKGKALNGFKFRRQHGFGSYIFDFYCPKARLAVELDGSAHDDEEIRRHDAARKTFIERFNIKILRFQNFDVYRNRDAVLEAIAEHLPLP